MIDIAYQEYQELKNRIESGEFIIREEFLEEKMYRNQYTIQHIEANQNIFFDMMQAYISKNKLPYVVRWGFDSVVVRRIRRSDLEFYDEAEQELISKR